MTHRELFLRPPNYRDHCVVETFWKKNQDRDIEYCTVTSRAIDTNSAGIFYSQIIAKESGTVVVRCTRPSLNLLRTESDPVRNPLDLGYWGHAMCMHLSTSLSNRKSPCHMQTWGNQLESIAITSLVPGLYYTMGGVLKIWLVFLQFSLWP